MGDKQLDTATDVRSESRMSGNLDIAHVHSELGLAGPASTGKKNDIPVIVLDPGHSGTDIASVDPKTGLNDHDYPNFPEIYEAWDVAQKVGANLEAAGYDVVFTKNSALDSVSLRQRAEIAMSVEADLAVSIHDDHGQKFDNYGEVFAQELGLWRGGTAANPRVTFTNKDIADKSLAAAANFVSERSRTEGRTVDLTQVNFAGREGIDPGNITQVQLYAGEEPHPVPWVYNEVGGIGYGPVQEAAYVQGLTDAIMKSVPIDQPAPQETNYGK